MMKSIGVIVVISILCLGLAGNAVWGAEITPGKLSPQDKCPVCGMFVAKYPDFVAQIILKDGTPVFFDGVKDMLKYYFDIARYNPGKTSADIAGIFVKDYYKMKLIDGFLAWYVVGSEVYGPMGRELIPFQDESAAKEFQADHKGKEIHKLKDITPEMVKSLD
jgi:copper chaperone NosL